MDKEKAAIINAYIEKIVPQGTFLNYSESGEESSFLSGGIININKKVFLPDNRDPAILNVFSVNGRRNIGRELLARRLISDVSVPVQRIIRFGVGDSVVERDYAFLIKEYKDGKTLDEVLTNSSKERLTPKDISSILSDLGKYLGQIHSVILPNFGKIEGKNIINPYKQCSWQDYYLHRLYQRINTLENLPPNKKIGNYTVKNILNLLPKITSGLPVRLAVLDQVTVPHLTHSDFHFLNIVASLNNGRWGISGILDLENITAGDPDVDLVSIESQLNLSPVYQNLFMNHVSDFRNSYNRPPSKHYQEKRWLYHLTWSLSYFEAVMQMDTKLHPVTSRISRYMKKHFEVIEALAKNREPRDLGIPTLY